MARPRTPITALRQVLLLHAERLGLSLDAMERRVRRWGLAKALTTPASTAVPPKQYLTMAEAIERYYASHPDDIPPWERGKKGIN